MKLGFFPDLISFRRQSRNITLLRERLDVVSSEAVTGRRQNILQAVRGEIGGVHKLNRALRDIEQSKQINALTSVRLKTMGSSLENVREVVTGLGSKALITATSAGPAGMSTLAEEAQAKLKTVVNALNIKQGDRFLFSGDRTGTLPISDAERLLSDIRNILTTSIDPVADINAYFFDPSGTFETDIYQGGTDFAPDIQLGDNVSKRLDIRADNIAIREALKGLAMLAASDDPEVFGPDIANNAAFKDMTSSLATSTEALIKLEGRIGVLDETINAQNIALDAENLVLNNALQNLIGRDQFDAAAELTLLEAQLEASYAISARLNNLSLVNYLR